MDRTQFFRHGLFGGIILLAFIGVAVSAAFAPEGDRADRRAELSGKIISQTRDVQDFDRVELRGSYDMQLTAGEDYALKLTGDEALLKRVKTRVGEGRLVIGPEEGTSQRTLEDLELLLGLPALAGLTVNGAADANLQKIDSEGLDLVINGAGRIKADGRCGRLNVTTNGAGDVDTKALRCKEVKVTINGAGDTTVYASEAVESVISGVGDVVVYGEPSKVEESKSGFGSLSIRGEPPAGE